MLRSTASRIRFQKTNGNSWKHQSVRQKSQVTHITPCPRRPRSPLWSDPSSYKIEANLMCSLAHIRKKNTWNLCMRMLAHGSLVIGLPLINLQLAKLVSGCVSTPKCANAFQWSWLDFDHWCEWAYMWALWYPRSMSCEEVRGDLFLFIRNKRKCFTHQQMHAYVICARKSHPC